MLRLSLIVHIIPSRVSSIATFCVLFEIVHAAHVAFYILQCPLRCKLPTLLYTIFMHISRLFVDLLVRVSINYPSFITS